MQFLTRLCKLGYKIGPWALTLLLLPVGTILAMPLTETMIIKSPGDFIIPVANQQGQMTIFSDNRALEVDPAGFNPFGSQTFQLKSGETSRGELTLNLHFSGPPLGDPSIQFVDASLQFTVADFDFLPDNITTSITLKEMAFISSVNGTDLLTPIDLAGSLPAGTTITDDVTVALDRTALIPPLMSSDFTNPMILSLTLSAEVTNTGWRDRNLMNTPESILGDVSFMVTTVPLPEPTSILLLGSGLAGLIAYGHWKRRKNRRP